MRSAILVPVLALWLAGAASAAEIGAQLAFPLPAGEVGDHQLGIHAGATANQFFHPNFGWGLDVAYQYWPVSPEFKTSYERRFYGLFKIGDPTWDISALQTTAHMKALAPLRTAYRPWAQLGAGFYIVDPRLEFMGEKLVTRLVPGAFISIGFDYDANPRLRLGLDASYHHLRLKQELGSDFNAFEVGTHLLFGRP